MIGDAIDELITLWRYSVPLINRRTGARQVVLVRLEPHEQVDALMNWFANGIGGSGGPDACVAYRYASDHALAGLSADWEAQASEITRIKVLH